MLSFTQTFLSADKYRGFMQKLSALTCVICGTPNINLLLLLVRKLIGRHLVFEESWNQNDVVLRNKIDIRRIGLLCLCVDDQSLYTILNQKYLTAPAAGNESVFINDYQAIPACNDAVDDFKIGRAHV